MCACVCVCVFGHRLSAYRHCLSVCSSGSNVCNHNVIMCSRGFSSYTHGLSACSHGLSVCVCVCVRACLFVSLFAYHCLRTARVKNLGVTCLGHDSFSQPCYSERCEVMSTVHYEWCTKTWKV